MHRVRNLRQTIQDTERKHEGFGMKDRSDGMENTPPCTCSVHPAQRGCWNCVTWSGDARIDEYAMCDEDFNRHARLHVCKHWKYAAQNAELTGSKQPEKEVE